METLEERFPVSASILGLAAGSVLALNASETETVQQNGNTAAVNHETTDSFRFFQNLSPDSHFDFLNLAGVDYLFSEQEPPRNFGRSGSSNLFADDIFPEFFAFFTETSQETFSDLTRQFGDDLLFLNQENPSGQTTAASSNFSASSFSPSNEVTTPLYVDIAVASGGGISASPADSSVADSSQQASSQTSSRSSQPVVSDTLTQSSLSYNIPLFYYASAGGAHTNENTNPNSAPTVLVDTGYVFQNGDVAYVETEIWGDIGWYGDYEWSIEILDPGDYWGDYTSVAYDYFWYPDSNFIMDGFAWHKPEGLENNDPNIDRDFTFRFTVASQYVDLDVHICYAEIKSVDFIGDNNHTVLSNWEWTTNNEWEKNDSFVYEGHPLEKEWYRDVTNAQGEYISVGTAYTRSYYEPDPTNPNATVLIPSRIKAEAAFDIDTGGRPYYVIGTGSYINFQSGELSVGTNSVELTSLSNLPTAVSVIHTQINWSIRIGSSGPNISAGTSGEHDIYVTYDTPIQSYTTDDGNTYENITTEKRLEWAVTQTLGATTATGGSVSNPSGAAEKMVAAVGHGAVPNVTLTFNWNAWGYMQNHSTVGDCGTMVALAVAGLGQIGVAAVHDRAFATTDSDATTMQYNNFTYKGQVFRAKLIYTGNNYEAFFTITDQGTTKAYTVYPKSGPYTNSNLHLDVLRSIVIGGGLSQYWVWDDNQTINGVTVYDWEVVPGQGIVPLPSL
jgi:hypothetical protein